MVLVKQQKVFIKVLSIKNFNFMIKGITKKKMDKHLMDNFKMES